MADENNTGSITEVAEKDATAKVPAPKKPRAPRDQKASAGATVAASLGKTAQLPSGRRKRAGQAKLTPQETQITGKSTSKDAIKDTSRKRTPKQIAQTAKTPLPALDEMADLTQLEEENKRLRKTLADKLRAENTDLRKRLGLV
ncbi:transcriptional regulator SyrB protein (plasmid) [Rhizobium gallicum]|uniref:Transcriptional regulator SyrB protein n=1 Tax=Rhizobium gallicum TaxID=56730 RepID=A0A1L5NSW1_9HYPH|nr:SyrB-like regulator [Rhizobium gallicum]APO70958.1 transcriptional regulator SyrB protein [Rhizobium gallicum]